MIKKIEELLINSDPSNNIIVDNGFLIRRFNTKNICTINMLADDRRSSYAEIIRSQAERLKKIKLDPCYRIVHESSYEALDMELVRFGFDILDRGTVMALRLENMERELFAFANFYEQGILVDEEMSAEWIEDYRDLMRMSPDYGDLFEENIRNSTEEKMFTVLIQNSRLIAMGYITFIEHYMIINNIIVDERFRNLDYGKRLLKAMLIKGLLKKCKYAICDVQEEQNLAAKMFLQEGFEPAYNYHYRGKRIT